VIFAGLATSTLIAIGLSVAALTVLLYVLKLRRRPVSVPFSFLWKRVLKDKEATHLFSQLKRFLSLLLQLVLVALLVLALGDPRLTDKWVEGRNVVVLVDVSASMKATDVPSTRLDAARAKLIGLIDGLGATDRMLIAEMGMAPRPLCTLTSDIATLKDAANRLEAVDTSADLERALGFAVDSLTGLSKPQVILLSDGALGDTSTLKQRFDLGAIDFSYSPIGGEGHNVAITAFSVRRYPLDKSRYEVLLEVMNTDDRDADIELTLLGDGEIVDVTRLHLAPNERLPRFYQDLAGASRTLEAVIKLRDGKDVLPADDHAYALMPDRKRVRVQLVSTRNTYLEAALLLDEYMELTNTAPDSIPIESSFDVTILDNVVVPLPTRHGARLYINPKSGGPVPSGKSITEFGFDTWDKKSPYLRWMAMENIQVIRGNTFLPEQGQKVVAASDFGPLLVSGTVDQVPFLALGFDPRDSDWVLRVAWPIFLLNTINAFIEEDTGYISSYATGQTWHVPAPSHLATANVLLPSGALERVPVKEGRAVYAGDLAGFYELRDDEGETLARFAANLGSPTESHVDANPILDVGKSSTSLEKFSAGGRKEIWVMLLLAVLAVSALEWFTYHRRVTI
jgi:Ca-activated chloride channel homolog